MTIPSTLLRCHAIEFGYLYDPGSGKPFRNGGRHLVRTTRGFPQGALAVALPARLAGHVSALPYVSDPEHDPTGVLLISPSYRRASPGLLQGAWVTVQRIRLNPLADAPHLPGDAVQASSLMFPWHDYAVHASGLGSTIARLSGDKVSMHESEGVRLDRPLVTIALSDSATLAASRIESALRAIVGAVLRGARLRLDSRWCATEADFVDAYLKALAHLPERLRGHVSAAAGLSCADRGFQIVWSLDDFGLDPDSETAQQLIELGATEALDQDRLDFLADDERFKADHGLVSATFEQPEFHAHLRRQIRGLFENCGTERAAAAPELQLSRYASGGYLSPADADRLLREVQRSSRQGVRAPRIGFAALLSGIASTASTVEEIATALELCDLADTVEGDIQVSRIHHLAGQLISARFAETVILPDELLSAVMRSAALAGVVAREFASGNQRAVEPLRRTLAGLAKRDRNAFRRVAGRVLPLDHRVLSAWNGSDAQDYCLAGALFDAIATPRRVDATAMETVSETLVAEGKWDLVREALLAAANSVSRGEDGTPPNGESLASRLRLVGAIARSMERNLQAPTSRTVAA
jgi:hypothetical protein